ncbi:MAG: D-alanine--D-alanine ligase [Anaerolineaceae bacterium]|nr:D-alanine--D-alanine ligase [Anaerolineaceae bacterium]
MSDQKINVALLFGGRSGEHEVSLNSARSVLSVLSPEKYNVTQIGITHDGIWLTGESVHAFLTGETEARQEDFTRVTFLAEPGNHTLYTLEGDSLTPLVKIDVVIPMLHGTFGEDGTLQGSLEMGGFAYVGAGVLGSSVGMDKALFKDVMRAHNIPVVDSITVSRKAVKQNLEAILTEAEAMGPYPFFTKPANLGSSVGITKCKNRSDLLEGIMEAARFDRRILIELGVDAREIEISVLGNEFPRASIPGEIVPCEEFYNYDAKYVDDDSELLIPAPIPPQLSAKMREIAVEAYKAIDCGGMARVDFLLEKHSERFFLNEVNTLPGFTKISMYPKLWEATGMSFTQLVEELIQLALDRKSERDQTVYTYES